MNSLLAAVLATFLLMLLPRLCAAEEPVKASVCDVLADPAAYNHKLIEINGDTLHFQTFARSGQTVDAGSVPRVTTPAGA